MLIHKVITSRGSQYLPEDYFYAPRFICFPLHISEVNPPVAHESRRANGRNEVSRTLHISISLSANHLEKIDTQ